MGEEGEIWRELKRQKREYQKTLQPTIQSVIDKPECKRVGDHYRIGDWDFWSTGIVYNYKTRKRTTIKWLIKILN